MKEEKKYTHKSYGMIDISRFQSNKSQFFGSDLIHSGGISISINNAEKSRYLHKEWYHGYGELIKIELSFNQFVDAITSGMNTSGVPCTVKRFNGDSIEQIDHVDDKREQFSVEMKDTQIEYKNKIDSILEMFDGNIGKKKVNEIKHQLEVLKSHISSNTNFVMESFDKSMEKTVTEAKHTVANYIDHKVHSLGIEGIKNQLQISLEKEK